MEEAWVKQVRGTDKCDLIIADNVMYRRYWAALQGSQQRFHEHRQRSGRVYVAQVQWHRRRGAGRRFQGLGAQALTCIF